MHKTLPLRTARVQGALNDRGAAIEINNIKLSSEGCLYEAVPGKQVGGEAACFAKLYIWQWPDV